MYASVNAIGKLSEINQVTYTEINGVRHQYGSNTLLSIAINEHPR